MDHAAPRHAGRKKIVNARLFAIALLCCAGPAAGADLGRFFFTPTQRTALDSVRKQHLRGDAAPEERKTAPVAQNVSVNGVVRRSDGRSTVWLNDRPVSGHLKDGINATPSQTDNRVKLTVPGSDRSIDLKVGQTVEIVSGTIAEGYARRAVPTRPAANAASGNQNTSPDAEKAAAPPASPPARSDAASPIRATRARAREMQDDARNDGGGERK